MNINIIGFRFYICSELRGAADVIRLAEIAVSQGLVLTNKNAPLPDGRTSPIPYHGDLQEFVTKVYKHIEYVEAPRILDCWGPAFSFAAITRLKYNDIDVPRPDYIMAKFHGHLQNPRYNHIDAYIPYRDEDNIYIEEIAKTVLRLGKAFYDYLQPSYGWLDDSDNKINEQESIQRGKKLSTISWANFWGADYVEKFGKIFLLNSPGWKTEELADGGIFYQVAESFKDPISLDLKNEISSYFAPAGVKYILGTHPHK